MITQQPIPKLFVFAAIVWATPLLAQNACRTTCASRFPAASQTSQMNACYATCGSVVAPSATTTTTVPVQTANPSGWNMNAAQRQLAVQNAEVQQSQGQLNAARSQELQAQLDQLQAQQQANVAASDATQAGLQTGMIQGTISAGKVNYDRRVNMVRDALTGPQAKEYTNRATAVSLADPFADPARPAEDDVDAWKKSLAATCMEMGDKDHPGAHVVACKAAPSSCKKMPAIGLYPVLQDGRLVNSAETLASFEKACADPAAPMTALDDNGSLVEVK